MKYIILTLAVLIPLSFAEADDRLDWLKSRPVSKQRVFSSNQGRSVPSGAWTVSSKDSRQRTMTITNRPIDKKEEAVRKGQSEAPLKQPERKKNEPVDSTKSASFNPAEVSPEDLNNYIAALETELDKLNSEVFPIVAKPTGKVAKATIKQLKTDAELALMTSNKDSLKSEFQNMGASMTDSQADAYMARLLKTLKSQK